MNTYDALCSPVFVEHQELSFPIMSAEFNLKTTGAGMILASLHPAGLKYSPLSLSLSLSLPLSFFFFALRSLHFSLHSPSFLLSSLHASSPPDFSRRVRVAAQDPTGTFLLFDEALWDAPRGCAERMRRDETSSRDHIRRTFRLFTCHCRLRQLLKSLYVTREHWITRDNPSVCKLDLVTCISHANLRAFSCQRRLPGKKLSTPVRVRLARGFIDESSHERGREGKRFLGLCKSAFDHWDDDFPSASSTSSTPKLKRKGCRWERSRNSSQIFHGTLRFYPRQARSEKGFFSFSQDHAVGETPAGQAGAT